MGKGTYRKDVPRWLWRIGIGAPLGLLSLMAVGCEEAPPTDATAAATSPAAGAVDSAPAVLQQACAEDGYDWENPDGTGPAPAEPVEQHLLDLVRYWGGEHYVWNEGQEPFHAQPKLKRELLARAAPDECFYEIGDAEPMADVLARGEVCGEGANPGTPKTDESYLWGVVRAAGSLWFGTVSNVPCLASPAVGTGEATTIETPFAVCQGEEDPLWGTDWRPPSIYRYVLAPAGRPGRLVKLDATLPPEAQALLLQTSGLRSAGALGRVVFIAGPAQITGDSGVNMFAFETTGRFLGARSFPEYADVRHWLTHKGVLYVAVGNTIVEPDDPGGFVLRWCGSVADPWCFQRVGVLDTNGADLVAHQGRLYAATWPSLAGRGTPRLAGLFRSPPVPPGGLTTAHQQAWVKIWDVAEYEPDPLVAASTLMGAIASFGNSLIWGTMQVPAIGALMTIQQQPELFDADGDGLEETEVLNTVLGMHRATAIFKGTQLDRAAPRFELLYGELVLPKYSATQKAYTIDYRWTHLNNMEALPRHGSSGAGNPFNSYVWSAVVYHQQLYLGTFDSSLLFAAGLASILGELGLEWPGEQVDELMAQLGERGVPVFGGDLFRIKDSSGRIEAESFDGVGNYTAYGVRNMLTDGPNLFIGTANPANLHPLGGWELLRLTPRR